MQSATYRQIALKCSEPAAGLNGLRNGLGYEQHAGAQQSIF